MNKIHRYGYNDPQIVDQSRKWTAWRVIGLIVAILFILGLWLALDIKLLTGESWLSPTYDNPDWRTNEGNLHTFGMWDLESHIWKSEYIVENFPHFQWNPYWYLGMPLLKYYQLSFYALHILFSMALGVNLARGAILLIIFAHLAATLLTFLLCYKISRKIWVSALAASFLLSNTFISLRSYGWEPITIVWFFLFPLTLLVFLREPLRPFRLSLILLLGLSYLSHPLIWFSLLMTMGLYLFSIVIRRDEDPIAKNRHYIWHYVGLTFSSILVGAIQFLPQFSYHQATSGAHMGVTYLPFYHVATNVISLKDFLFDAGNLKGPGPVVMIAFFLVILYGIYRWRHRAKSSRNKTNILGDEMILGLLLVLVMMVLFYYLELFNIFPMNVLRSIQYHRIIPEFIVVAAALIATLSNRMTQRGYKITFYAMLIAFVIASSIIIYNIQDHWQTSSNIGTASEFIYEPMQGRMTMPYTDQSLSVRNSFTKQPQVYGYYEQGITNAYNDELFSVSSGFHNTDVSILHFQASNVGRLYVNLEEGERDRIVIERFEEVLEFTNTTPRYGYFTIPLDDPSYAQAVDISHIKKVQELQPQCRVMFQEEYCGSYKEEFVSRDVDEIAYLRAYVEALQEPESAQAKMRMVHPDLYHITMSDASQSTAAIIKMTYDKDFVATVNGVEVPIEPVGPDFMLIKPATPGEYTIELRYEPSIIVMLGAAITFVSIVGFIGLFILRPKIKGPQFKRGDL